MFLGLKVLPRDLSSHLHAKDPLYLQAPRTHYEQRQGHSCYGSATVNDVMAVIGVGHDVMPLPSEGFLAFCLCVTGSCSTAIA